MELECVKPSYKYLGVQRWFRDILLDLDYILFIIVFVSR